MTYQFKSVQRQPNVSAPSGNPTYNTDNVDRAVWALGNYAGTPVWPNHVLAYVRAKRWPTSSGFGGGLVDRFGNPVSSGTYALDATHNATDSNFNGQSSVDLSPLNGLGSGNNSCFEIQGGIGLNQQISTLPASFTVVETIRQVASGPSVQNLCGTTDGVVSYLNTTGSLTFSPNGGTNSTTFSGLVTSGAACVLWYSWDNAAQIVRAAVNTTAGAAAQSNAGTLSPTSGGKLLPFGYKQFNLGQTFYGQFETFLFCNKAYMNGVVPGDDALFTSLISTLAAAI